MIDKSLNIFLMALLATGGIVILVMTWIMPIPLSERIVPSFIGAIGLIVVLIWTLVLRSKSAKGQIASLPDKTDAKKGRF